MPDTVVLLTIDALGAGHVGHLGYDRETTPRLDALTDGGATYLNCVAQSSHTRESMPSLFLSAYPLDVGGVGPVPEDRPTLATVLGAAGFETAGFHSNPYLSRAYGFDRGFDTFDDGLPLARNRVVTFLHRVKNHLSTQPYVRAEDLVERGLDWLDETDADRRFLWLHFMDPHGPYQPPERHQRRFLEEPVGSRRAKRLWRRSVDDPDSLTEGGLRTLEALYDAEIRYTDEVIGEFLEELSRRGLRSESLVIVGADHGDAFGEDGVVGHPREVVEELVHVPLVVFGSGVPSDVRVSRVVENVDVAPTICEHCGVSPPLAFAGEPLPFDGSVTGGTGVAEASGEGADRELRRFAVRSPGRLLRAEFDLEGTVRERVLEDVGLEDTGTETEAPSREELTAVLDEHVRKTDALEATPETEDGVDDVVADRLADLGYR